MNQIAEIVDISALARATTPGRFRGTDFSDQASSTLRILPMRPRHQPDLTNWLRARQRLGQIAGLRADWDTMDGIPPDPHTVSFAAKELASLESLGVPAPTINPSADGAVYAEWHMRGLDIEIIFEAPYQIVILVEDAQGVLPPLEDEANDLRGVLGALQTLSSR